MRTNSIENRNLIIDNKEFIKAVMVESIHGFFYLIDPDDCFIGKALRENGKYSETQLSLVKSLIDAQDKLLIVGAHIGTFAIPLSKECQSVTAIEANPVTFELLKKNILLNNCNNCYPYNFAAHDTNSDIEFLLNTHNTGGSKRKPKISKEMYYYDNPEIISIPGKKLDDEFENCDFDLIIMDIEGSEYFALKGMTNILSRTSCLIIEFLPHHLKYVSNVNLNQFYDVLSSFSNMVVPSINVRVQGNGIFDLLKYMFENDMGDDGLIFFHD